MIDVHLAAPTASDELRRMFLDACARPTSIHQHLTVMRDTASGVKHITEMGVGEGWSTLAWLLVQPDKLVCYDLGWQDCIPVYKRLRGRTDFRFYVGHSQIVEIEETDLLFLDTSHSYKNLKEELRLHAGKARQYIILHDTTTFADHGEDGSTPGLWQAVEEFLYECPEWRVMNRFMNNNGLTILGKNKMRLPTLCKTLDRNDYSHLKDEVAQFEYCKSLFSGCSRVDHEHRAWEYGIVQVAVGPAKNLPGKKVLDVGGGDSILGGILARRGADVTVVDVSDYNVNTAEMGRRAGNGSMKYLCSALAEPLDETFDAVLCISVIEHVPTEQVANFFANLCRATRHGGVLVITCDFHPSGLAQFNGHERTFSAERLLGLARDAVGFVMMGEPDYAYRSADIFGLYTFASLAMRKQA